MTNKILFIVEQHLIDGQAYFGASNDLLLIVQALRKGWQVYLCPPKDVAQKFSALKLSNNLDWQKINQIIKSAWCEEVINAFLKIPSNPDLEAKTASKILFLDSKKELIDICTMKVFNRAEPVSLTEEFYKTLISLQNNRAKILPNPALNQILGDKLAVWSIHYKQKISNIDLLQDVDFQDQENQISFETKIISLGVEDLNNQQISQFYALLEEEKFLEAQKLFAKNYQIFSEAIEQYLQFHQQLNDDSIIKPANYFGGVGVVVSKNQKLDFNQAVKNIVSCFLAIKEDSTKNNQQNLANLSKIIVQQRATEASLGDLRIVLAGKNLQGIFVRINPNFAKFNVGNLHFGGFAKSLFNGYEISKDGTSQMIANLKEAEEIKKAEALYDLLEKIEFLQKIKTFSAYPIIGVDALLSRNSNGKYYYGINEINLTSPMGQVQIILLEIVNKLQKHFFGTKEILLQNKNLQALIESEIERYFIDNIANQTLEFFI